MELYFAMFLDVFLIALILLFKILTAFNFITFLNVWIIIFNFKFSPYFNMSQSFVQNVRTIKLTSILGCWENAIDWLVLKVNVDTRLSSMPSP